MWRNLLLVSGPVVKDRYKTVVIRKPYTVEECEDRLVGGDKTGSTLGGAIIGAAIGNAIGKDTEATVAGAVIGGAQLDTINQKHDLIIVPFVQ